MSNPALEGRLAAPQINNTTSGYTLPAGLLGIWVGAGQYFQNLFPIDTDDGIDGLVHWWFSAGWIEFPGIREIIHRPLLLGLIEAPLEQASFNRVTALCLTPLQAIINRCRPDIQAQKPPEQSIEFYLWRWWLAGGQMSYCTASRAAHRNQLRYLFALATSNDDDDWNTLFVLGLSHTGLLAQSDITAGEALSDFLEAFHFSFVEKLGENLDLSPLLKIIHRSRPDLREAFDIESRQGRANLWSWWHYSGQSEFIPNSTWIVARSFTAIALRAYANTRNQPDELDALGHAQLHQIKALQADQKIVAALRGLWVAGEERGESSDQLDVAAKLALFVWGTRPDLQAAFDIRDVANRTALLEWWLETGWLEYAPSGTVLIHPDRTPAKSEDDPVSPPIQFVPNCSPISLVGYPRGEFGLGEDIRLLRSALRTAGIEPDVIKAPWNIIARQTIDEQAEEADTADFNSDVMLYVMPAFDTLTLLNKVGLRAFQARRKIGYWQWELDRFPEPAKIAFDLVDEIWCHSEHSAKAFRSATEKPVVKVPLPVLVPEVERVPRSTFGFSDRDYIVFSSFDGASSISRKNPMGVILAFQQAFPRIGWPDARLVIKAMNTIDDALWRDCLRKAALDDRIQILNRVLDRNEYYQLLQCCDIVLSMHRAEGFGRVMAEAMALGIPTVATGYSGNLDFMNADNSWLVPGVLSPLIPGDYPFYQGQEWLEPDIGEAAKALRDCFENQEKRARLVENAKATIERYSPVNCGRFYAELLAS